MKKIIISSKAPKPTGPYSQAVQAGGFLFISGMVGLDPRSGRIVAGGVREQTRQAIENLLAILSEAGLGIEDVVKVNVFLRNIDDFKEFNEAYAKFFTGRYPARTTVQAAPPLNALVEIEAVAVPRAP